MTSDERVTKQSGERDEPLNHDFLRGEVLIGACNNAKKKAPQKRGQGKLRSVFENTECTRMQ
jgi:hypothetical protein